MLMMMQVGMPADQAQYIHRVGRTARAGKLGKALLMLHDFENRFIGSLKDLPVETLQPNSLQVCALSCCFDLPQLCACPCTNCVCWEAGQGSPAAA